MFRHAQSGVAISADGAEVVDVVESGIERHDILGARLDVVGDGGNAEASEQADLADVPIARQRSVPQGSPGFAVIELPDGIVEGVTDARRLGTAGVAVTWWLHRHVRRHSSERANDASGA